MGIDGFLTAWRLTGFEEAAIRHRLLWISESFSELYILSLNSEKEH